jgi:hypothetical protein
MKLKFKKKDDHSYKWSDDDNWTDKDGKKAKKPKAVDEVQIDGSVIVDCPAECKSLTGTHKLFYIRGGSLVVNGIKKA